ncbi:MAG: hypothetical protein KC416_14525, partial [Myxococcales bacterium]|nr:hypothetical protein [Myxococcales bacterium]
FQFKYDDKAEQYAHAAVMMLLTPDAKIARYLYGVEFNPNDVRFGLLEASEGRSISTSEQLLLYCYSYDPKSNSYVLMATRIMKIGGALTMLFLFGFLALFWRRELRRRRRSDGSFALPDGPRSGQVVNP